jgi:hypothetical protein
MTTTPTTTTRATNSGKLSTGCEYLIRASRVRVAPDRYRADEQGERVVAVAAEKTVEEAAGDLPVLRRERRQRDVVQDLLGHAAEEQHAGQGDDERRDADVGDPEAVPRTDGEADGEGGEDADPPRLPVPDDHHGRHRTGQRHHGADREVDVPGDDHDDHADGQHQDVGVLQDDVRDVAGAQRDAVVGEHEEQRHDRHERDVDAAGAQVAADQRTQVVRARMEGLGRGRILRGRVGFRGCGPGHPTDSLSLVMSSMSPSWVASRIGS